MILYYVFSNIPGIGVDDVFVIVQSYEIVSKELPADCSMPYKLAATMKSAVSFKLCYVTRRQSQRGYCTPPIIFLWGHEKIFYCRKILNMYNTGIFYTGTLAKLS